MQLKEQVAGTVRWRGGEDRALGASPAGVRE